MGQGPPSTLEHLQKFVGLEKETLTSEPWRNIGDWKEKKEKLKEEIRSLSPKIHGDFKVSHYKIILAGIRTAGKSSFFNSINSIFTNRVVTTGESAGEAASSVTSSYFEHGIYEGDTQLAFKICDTMGLTKAMSKVDVDNIIASVDGHVPHKYKFAQGVKFKMDDSGYIENPSIADMAHCVAFVLNGKTLNLIAKEVWDNLHYLWRALNSRNIPMFILLTHADEVCEEVKKDVKNTYRSIAIRDDVKLVSSNLCGIPGAQIFPVINYRDQTELENDMDILLLYALRQMLYAAQANLNNK